MKTIIMAGGKGTRISSMVSGIPKPMIKIAGKPVLEHEIVCLREQGFTDFIITVSHFGSIIMDYFGDGKKYGVNIQYFNEVKPLGNAGALFKLREQLDDDFLLLNADAIFNVDFNRFIKFHRSHGGLVTLFAHPNNHPYDSGLLITNTEEQVIEWLAKEDKRPQWYRNIVNAGLHVINPLVLDMTGINANNIGTEVDGKIFKVDLDRQVLKPLCGTGKIYCYDSPEYVKDMGTPERYKEVCTDFSVGKIEQRNLKYKQKAVFFNCDGIIKKYMFFLRNLDDFVLLPGVAEAIKRINLSGYLTIIVINQPVVTRGEVTYSEMQVIHNMLETLLGQQGAYIDKIYFCPYQPYKDFDDEVTELKVECNFRKLKSDLLLRALEDYNVDFNQSWIIGDSESNIRAGNAVGCKTILLGDGEYGQDIAVQTLNEAMDYILINIENIE